MFHFAGPLYQGPSTRNDVIYAAQHVHGSAGSGSINLVCVGPNQDAINAAFGGNTDTSNAQVDPGYSPPSGLATAISAYNNAYDAYQAAKGAQAQAEHPGGRPHHNR